MEAAIFGEAGAGNRVSLPPFLPNVENLNVVQFFCKTYDKKLLFNKPAFAKKPFKSLWFTIRAAPYRFKSELCSLPTHFYLRVFKKFAVLVQKFRRFSQNFGGSAHF